MLQNTPEWTQARIGHITGSKFAAVMTKPRGQSDPISATAEAYLYQLLGEHLTGRPADDIDVKATQWGNENEPAAVAAYQWQTGVHVEHVGFLKHPDQEWVGCSPDGLIGDDGVLECKCPYTTKEHIRTLVTGEVPSQYVAQVQGAMWVTGRQWCDFVSYDPRCEEPAQLAIVRVDLDKKYIERLERSIEKFRMMLFKQLKKIRENGNV